MHKLFSTNQNQAMERSICGGNTEMEKSLCRNEKFNYLKNVSMSNAKKTLASYRNTVTLLRFGEQGKRPSGFLKDE